MEVFGWLLVTNDDDLPARTKMSAAWWLESVEIGKNGSIRVVFGHE